MHLGVQQTLLLVPLEHFQVHPSLYQGPEVGSSVKKRCNIQHGPEIPYMRNMNYSIKLRSHKIVSH